MGELCVDVDRMAPLQTSRVTILAGCLVTLMLVCVTPSMAKDGTVSSQSNIDQLKMLLREYKQSQAHGHSNHGKGRHKGIATTVKPGTWP